MARRTFNVSRARRIVMMASGLVFGFWSAVSGITAQSAAGPYLTFMLGYAAPKAVATASVLALWSALGALGGWFVLQRASVPLAMSLWSAAGAVTGVLVTARVVRSATSIRRVGQGLVVILSAFVVSEGVRSRFGGMPALTLPMLQTGPGWFVIGALAGALGQVLALPTGIFMVPAFVFGVGAPPAVAMMASLLVGILAIALPVVSYTRHSFHDPDMARAMSLGGVAGGLAGGWLLGALTHTGATWPLAVFGVTAMLLAAWLAYRSD